MNDTKPATVPKITDARRRLLRALFADPDQEMYGLQLAIATGLGSGTVQPILTRFEDLGWAVSRWEEAEPSNLGRHLRKYYKLTEAGLEKAQGLQKTGNTGGAR